MGNLPSPPISLSAEIDPVSRLARSEEALSGARRDGLREAGRALKWISPGVSSLL